MTAEVIELRAISFKRSQLDALSDEELELLLRMGLAVNDLTMCQRQVVAVIHSEPRLDVLRDIWLVQYVISLLNFVGKMHEALLVFSKLFSASPVGKEYQSKLSQDGLAAVKELNQLMGTSNLLARVRNRFSFHFHTKDPLKPFLAHLHPDARLSLYFNQWDVNIFNHFAAEPYITALNSLAESQSTSEMLERLGATVLSAKKAFDAFFRAVAEPMFAKMGELESAVHPLEAADMPPLADIKYPPIVRPE